MEGKQTGMSRHLEDADDMHEAEVMSRYKARSRSNFQENQSKTKIVSSTQEPSNDAEDNQISSENVGGIDAQALADITRTVQVEMTQQLKAITEEMNRLKKEIYSEDGGLADIQKALTNLRQAPSDQDKKSGINGDGSESRKHSSADGFNGSRESSVDSESVQSQDMDGENARVEAVRRVELPDRPAARQRLVTSSVPTTWDSPSSSWDSVARGTRRSSTGRSEWDQFTSDIHGSRSEQRPRQSNARPVSANAVQAADWRVYFIVFMVLLLGPMRGVLREVYRLFVEDDGGNYGYDDWGDGGEDTASN